MSKQVIPELDNSSFNLVCLTELASSSFDAGGLKFAIDTMGVDSVQRWIGFSPAEKERMIDMSEKAIGQLITRVRFFTTDVELIEGDDDAPIVLPELDENLCVNVGVIIYAVGSVASFALAHKRAIKGGNLDGALTEWGKSDKNYRSSIVRRAIAVCNWLLVQINERRASLEVVH